METDVAELKTLEGADKPEASLSEADLMELTAAGQRALGQGRAESALSQAESILESAPEFVPALALKGDALERLDKIPEALAAYEQVLALRPDSALDRIRATHLKRLAESQELEVEETPPYARALMAAGAAALLFVVVAIAIYLSSQGSVPKTTVAQNDAPVIQQFDAPAPVPTVDGTGDGASLAGGPTALPPGAADPIQSNNPASRRDVLSGDPGYLRPPRSSSGSRALNPGDGGNIEPVVPEVPGRLTNTSVRPIDNQPGINPNGGPTAAAAPPTGDSGADAPDPIQNTRRENPGVIDIRPSQGSEPARNGNSGSAEIQDEQDAKQSAATLIRVARDAFVRGDYNKAADAYEKALRQGASRGSTNQRLAQCYERLGRKGEAVSAYEQAISSYQSQLSSGEENSRISAALDSCRQALKNIRG